MRLVSWTSAELVRRLDDVIRVYGDAMRYSPELLAARRGYIVAHTHRPGFRAVATTTDDGTLAGFGYGYTCRPGQWWHDQVTGALSGPQRAWLASSFEVVELHVHPWAQGHQLGAAQLRGLLAPVAEKTVLLSTPEADEASSRAWRLYRRFGFTDVLRDFHFPGDERPFAVLGRELPLPMPATVPHYQQTT